MDYSTFLLTTQDQVATLSFNRPEKANALDETAWKEMHEIFMRLDDDDSVRVIILKGEGKHFCSGIDVSLLMSLSNRVQQSCEGRKRESLRRVILDLQQSVQVIQSCRKPVIASIHGACIGGGIDIISACDMRYSTGDAYFSVREIDMGMVADLGTLQRLPGIVGEGIAREWAFTGKKIIAEEAKQSGLINNYFASKEELDKKVYDIASTIASKSPLSIRGIKEVMNYSRDHSIEEGLNYVATWNSAMLMSEDLMKAAQAFMMKTTAQFED